jgi:UDP-N-acetylglucosamine acyltransferase
MNTTNIDQSQSSGGNRSEQISTGKTKMAQIHPTAIVDPQAELADSVTVEPYAIISGPVRIGEGTIIHAHTHVQGKTVIGKDCRIGPTAFIGLPAQHLRADATIGQTVIGDRVVIRELATVHRSTHAGDDHATRVGDDCFLMGAVHIAHDCILENGVIAANAVLMGGHCHIGRKAFLGGGCTLHQFVRIGHLAIVSGNEPTSQDIPPFASFRYGGLKGYNAIGCKREGFSHEEIHAIRSAYHCFHSHRNLLDVVKAIKETVPDLPVVREILDFIATSKRGIVPSLSQRGVAGGGGTGKEWDNSGD